MSDDRILIGTIDLQKAEIDRLGAKMRGARMILGAALGPKLEGMEPVGKEEWREIAERAYGILGRDAT